MRSRVVMIFAVIAVLSAGLWSVTPLTQPASGQEDGITFKKVEGAQWRPEYNEPLFIAVLGSDVRNGPPGGRGGRCDAIHIVAINPEKKKGTVLNFPRDSYLPVPGQGTRKITEACFFGGTDSIVQALKNHTGLPIQYYVTTEFSHFRELINELGGITVDVPYRMFDPPSGADFDAGPVNMSGGQALAFNRNRKNTPNGDFSRTDNQGIFIIASLAKYREEVGKNPHRLVDYLKAVRRHVKVTVPMTEMIKLSLLALEIDPKGLQNVSVPGRAGAAGAASVVYLSPGDTYDRVKDDGIY